MQPPITRDASNVGGMVAPKRSVGQVHSPVVGSMVPERAGAFPMAMHCVTEAAHVTKLDVVGGQESWPGMGNPDSIMIVPDIIVDKHWSAPALCTISAAANATRSIFEDIPTDVSAPPGIVQPYAVRH